MKIIRAHAFGGPEQLTIDEVDLPEPGPGQLRLRVRGIGVNPVDWKLLSGKAPVLPPLPLVPGGDVAGTVDAVGQGVEGWEVGDPAFAHPGLMGGYAEAIVLDAAKCAPLPAGLDPAQAAGLPLVALTAWQGLLADGRDLSDLHVLVHNAAGGVGSVAVQIVKAKGGRVTGTASAANAAYVRELGAAEVVDFRVEQPESWEPKVDVLLDLVGNSQESGLWSLVKPGGSVIRIAGGPKAPDFEEVGGVRAYKVRVRPNGAQLREIAALVEAGLLSLEIAETHGFEQAAEALRASMSGHVRGKIVITAD